MKYLGTPFISALDIDELDTYKCTFKHNSNELDFTLRRVEKSNVLIVAFPSALAKNESGEPIYHRWSWGEKFDTNFVSLSDPSFKKVGLLGGWFIDDGDRDIIQEYSVLIKKIANELGIDNENIVFYGSSMGGFGALMTATYFEGSLCVAEVPQLDLRNYPWKSAIAAIESKCLNGTSLEGFYKSYPERVSVIERMKKNSNFPNCEIISNFEDEENSELLTLQKAYKSYKTDNVFTGSIGLLTLSRFSGHKPLPTLFAVKILKFILRKQEIINKTLK